MKLRESNVFNCVRLSVCLFTGGFQPYGTPAPLLYKTLAPRPCRGPDPAPFSRTYSNLLNLALTVQGTPSPDMFKLFHYEACTVNKKTVGSWHPTGMLPCFWFIWQNVEMSSSRAFVVIYGLPYRSRRQHCSSNDYNLWR